MLVQRRCEVPDAMFQNVGELELPLDMMNPVMKWGFKFMGRSLRSFLHIDGLNELYSEVLRGDTNLSFQDRMLKGLNVTYKTTLDDRAAIPPEGPVIVVANHPFGGIEGIILASLLASRRPDAKIMASYMVGRFSLPEFHDTFIFVDPYGKTGSVKSNIKPIRDAIRWVKQGGMLGVFPAGEVSHFHLRQWQIADPRWSDTVARIIRKTGASVLPVYFDGFNSRLFHLFGLLHPRLRTLMLPRESFNKAHKEIEVVVGRPISFEKLSKYRDDKTMSDYIRLRTHMLAGRAGGVGAGERRPRSFAKPKPRVPVVTAQPQRTMVSELNGLPEEQILVDSDKFRVYRATAQQIPAVLAEIGRLREITFRGVGEGTGKARDLDRFDSYYTHLFLWNKEKNEVVGGYRMGLTDEILDKYGEKGLYTNTLFEFGPGFPAKIRPAMELGRSFVRLEYQKSYQPLMLLWKGIGRFVADNPGYGTLFGPVSISRGYESLSKHLIVAFSKKNCRMPELAGQVAARHPVKKKLIGEGRWKKMHPFLQDIQDLSDMVSDIEIDRKGIPILLKHYWKLGGECLAFNLDREFNDVLDALIFVDLTKTEPRILERYMGKEGAGAFLSHHCGELAEAVCA